jgi:hypothetical protein
MSTDKRRRRKKEESAGWKKRTKIHNLFGKAHSIPPGASPTRKRKITI